MLIHPKIKLISDDNDKDEIEINEKDLLEFNMFRDDGVESQMICSKRDKEYRAFIPVRNSGELVGKALFLPSDTVEPKIVRDSQDALCLIFVKKSARGLK